jgi:hypothetical protein
MLDDSNGHGQLFVGHPSGEPAGVEPPAPAFSSGQWLFSGGCYLQEESVLWVKTKLDDVSLAVDSSVAGSPLVLTILTDSPTFEPGLRLTLGKIIGRDAWNRDHCVEVRFLGLFEWETQAEVAKTFDVPNFGIDTTLGLDTADVAALHDNDRQIFREHSTLDSFEVNYRVRTRNTRDRLVLQHDGQWIRQNTATRIWSGYFGLAKIDLNEDAHILGLGPETTRGEYDVDVVNDLFGVQAGGEKLEQYTHWQWGFRGRVGSFWDSTERHSSFISTIDPIGAVGPTTTNRVQAIEKDTLAILLEGGVFAAYQIHPNATVRAGYDLLWLHGVAQASGNLGLPVGTFTPLEINDDAFYHGGSVGLTLVW